MEALESLEGKWGRWGGAEAEDDGFFKVAEGEEFAGCVGLDNEELEGVGAHVYSCKEGGGRRRGW